MRAQGAAARPAHQQTQSNPSGLTFETSWSKAAPLPYHRWKRTCLRLHNKPEAEPAFKPKTLDS